MNEWWIFGPCLEKFGSVIIFTFFAIRLLNAGITVERFSEIEVVR